MVSLKLDLTANAPLHITVVKSAFSIERASATISDRVDTRTEAGVSAVTQNPPQARLIGEYMIFNCSGRVHQGGHITG